VHNANGIFLNPDATIRAEWKQIAERDFGATVETADFRHLDAAKAEINTWVKDQTKGKITEIIPSDYQHATSMALVNALDFDTPWKERFTLKLTQPAPFFIARGKAKVVPLMFKQHEMRYAHKAGFQMAALPYDGGAFQFVMILPDAVDGLAAVEKQLDASILQECISMPPKEVRLSLPRFKMEGPIRSMKDLLSKLGMAIAFGGGADFTGITKQGAEIAEVFHRTSITLDEDGTAASAASATMMFFRNGVPKEIPHEVVKADHPFLFLIQEVQTGACLFVGRMTDPASEVPATTLAPARVSAPGTGK
jgi:serpin B